MKADTLLAAVAEAERENAALKKLVALRTENAELRYQLGVPGDARESLRRIMALVCAHFNVTEADLLQRCRTERVAFPRQVVWFVCREFTPLTQEQLGAFFSRDHGTVHHGLSTVRNRIETDPGFAHRFERLRGQVAEALREETQPKETP